jgi:hypothetical protein
MTRILIRESILNLINVATIPNNESIKALVFCSRHSDGLGIYPFLWSYSLGYEDLKRLIAETRA